MAEEVSREQVEYFMQNLDKCRLCPRECGVNRKRGEIGYCSAGAEPKVASYCLHHGEEPPISGRHGSGTIFFSHCNMRCVYCQNYPISHYGYGNIASVDDLAQMMLDLQRKGAHNINLVTPTHYLSSVVLAILKARKTGLLIPIVYNTSGYEKPETLRNLRDIVDIYLFDIRYWSCEIAAAYSDAADYPHFNRKALREAIRMVGSGLLTHHGIATRGVILRHLVLPSHLSETRAILKYVSQELPQDTPLSLMFQFFPANRAFEFSTLNRKLSRTEREYALSLVESYGISHGWIQDETPLNKPIA